MKIPVNFDGYVSFFLNTEYGMFSPICHTEKDICWADGVNDRVRISAPIRIMCEFFDVRAAQIEALEKQIEKERAESQFRINQMLGKIQELQALEVKS